MSKKFKFKDGYVGTVSDGVAVILAKKGAGSVVGDAEKPEPKKADPKKDKE